MRWNTWVFVMLAASSSCSGQRANTDSPAAVQTPPPSAEPSQHSSQGDALWTPGHVRCGTHQCDLRDSYCKNVGDVESISLGCAPKGPDFDPDDVVPHSLLCDDASDCQAGEVCCQNPVPGGFVVYACGKPPCSLREACIEGGACQPGLTCEPSKDSPTGALCVATDQGAQCGKDRCSGARPVCCWDETAGTGTCVPEGEPCATNDNGKVAYRCSSKADCAGYFCAFQADGSFCVGWRYVFMGVVCMTDGDCPPRSPQTSQPYAGCEMTAVGSGRCEERDD
jgi:hypothetical protein